MLSWDRKRFAGYIVKYFCKVWDSQGMFIFVPFPSLGFSQLLQRDTATGIIPDPAQELSCVLPQQEIICFLVSDFLVGREHVARLSLLPFVLS